MIWALLFVLMGYGWFMVERLRWPAEHAPFITVMWIVMVLYVFSLVGCLRLGTYLVIGIGFGLFLGIVWWRGRYAWKSFRHLLCPGMVVFIAGFWLLWLKYPSYTYSSWDEFSHWGRVIKEMVSTNGLIGAGSSLSFKDYPPATALFQYFVLSFTGYSEGHTYFAQNLILLSGIVCLLKNIEWKRYLVIVLALLFGYMAIVFLSLGFENLSVDHIVGFVFGVSLLIYFFAEIRNNSAILQIIPAIFCLPLIKLNGLFFAVIIVVIVCIDQVGLVRRRFVGMVANDWRRSLSDRLQRRQWLMQLLVITILIASPLLANNSWQGRLSSLNLSQHFKPRVSLREAGRSFSQEASLQDKQVINAFLDSFDKTPVGKTIKTHSSEVASKGLLVWVVILVGLYWYINGSSRETHRIIVLHAILLVGFGVYSCGLLYLYLSAFSPYEALRVASYGRYMSSYWLGWSLVICATYLYPLRKDAASAVSKQRSFVVVLAVVALLMFISTPLSVGFCKSRFFPPEMSSMRKTIRQMAEDIASVVPTTNKVYVIWQNTSGFEPTILRYELDPRRANFWSWSLGDPYFKGDIWTTRMTPEEWSDTLRGGRYDFVVVGHADEKFWKTYGSLFKNIEISRNSRLFKVVLSAGKTVELLPVQFGLMPGESIILRDFPKTPQQLALRSPELLCSQGGYVRISTPGISHVIPQGIFKSNSELVLYRDGRFRVVTTLDSGKQCIRNCENGQEWEVGYRGIAWSQTNAELKLKFIASSPISLEEISVQMRNYADKQDVSARIRVSLDGGQSFSELPEQRSGYLATNKLSWSGSTNANANQTVWVSVIIPRQNMHVGIDGIWATFTGSMGTNIWEKNKDCYIKIENRTSIPLELKLDGIKRGKYPRCFSCDDNI